MTTAFSALTFTSDDPAQLAAFYRDAIGIPFALNQHGTTHPHHECDLHGIHFAILPSTPNLGEPVTPVFSGSMIWRWRWQRQPRSVRRFE